MFRPSFDEDSIRFDVYLPGEQISLPDRAGECDARRVFSSRVDDRDRPARNLVQVRTNGRNLLSVSAMARKGDHVCSFACSLVYSCGPMT